MFFLNNNVVKIKVSDSMTVIWIGEVIFRWINNCVDHFSLSKKQKSHPVCPTLNKRLSLPETKFTLLTSKLLHLKLSVKITYFTLMKIALNKGKILSPGNKDDIRTFSPSPDGSVRLASWKLYTWHCLSTCWLPDITSLLNYFVFLFHE